MDQARGSDEPRLPPPGVYRLDSEHEEAALAKRKLAGVVRGLIDDVFRLDAAAAREAVEDAVAMLEDVRARLAELPSLEASPESWPPHEASLSERSPLVGRGNPLAAPLTLWREGDVVKGSAVYGPSYQGGWGDMHGGVVAAAFDDLLGCVQMLSPVSGRTGTLIVRFRSPSPIGRRIDYEARVDRVEGRKVFCSGEARHGDTLLAEAEAIFVSPRRHE